MENKENTLIGMLAASNKVKNEAEVELEPDTNELNNYVDIIEKLTNLLKATNSKLLALEKENKKLSTEIIKNRAIIETLQGQLKNTKY